MKEEKEKTSKAAGIGLFGGIFLVFLFLKLAEFGVVANWSWWWVTAPLWAPLLIVLAIALIGFVILGIINTFRK